MRREIRRNKQPHLLTVAQRDLVSMLSWLTLSSALMALVAFGIVTLFAYLGYGGFTPRLTLLLPVTLLSMLGMSLARGYAVQSRPFVALSIAMAVIFASAVGYVLLLQMMLTVSVLISLLAFALALPHLKHKRLLGLGVITAAVILLISILGLYVQPLFPPPPDDFWSRPFIFAGIGFVAFAMVMLLRQFHARMTLALTDANVANDRLTQSIIILQRRREVADALRLAMQALNTQQSLPDALDVITRQAKKLMGAQGCAVFKMVEDTTQPMVHQVASNETSQPYFLRQRFNALQHAYSSSELVCEFNQPVWVVDVPLVVQGVLFGGMSLYFNQSRELAEDDVQLAYTLANQISLAIESARLRYESARVAERETRNKLGRELHDSATQSVYGLSLFTNTARLALEQEPPDVAKAYESVKIATPLAESALADMRALIVELRPEALIKDGLFPTLAHYAQAYALRYHIPVHTQFLGDESNWSPQVKENVYRISTEAMHNISKHAKAREIWLCIAFELDMLKVSVVDDGEGFMLNGHLKKSYGLSTMRERAEELGGKLFVESALGAGTKIAVDIPKQ